MGQTQVEHVEKDRGTLRTSPGRLGTQSEALSRLFSVFCPSPTMKFALFSAALLAGSASAFAPAQQGGRVATTLNAEMSKSLPFMKKPALVSRQLVHVAVKDTFCLHICEILSIEVFFSWYFNETIHSLIFFVCAALVIA